MMMRQERKLGEEETRSQKIIHVGPHGERENMKQSSSKCEMFHLYFILLSLASFLCHLTSFSYTARKFLLVCSMIVTADIL